MHLLAPHKYKHPTIISTILSAIFEQRHWYLLTLARRTPGNQKRKLGRYLSFHHFHLPVATLINFTLYQFHTSSTQTKWQQKTRHAQMLGRSAH